MSALSNEDLEQFCKENNLPFHLVDLQDLQTVSVKNAFIFTGFSDDSINKGNDHHWLFLDGSHIFDSYGNPGSYKLPEGFTFIENSPRQLQAYGSEVCGQYCCAFYFFSSKYPTIPVSELGEAFSDEFGFTKNKKRNDKIVASWFNDEEITSSEEEM